MGFKEKVISGELKVTGTPSSQIQPCLARHRSNADEASLNTFCPHKKEALTQTQCSALVQTTGKIPDSGKAKFRKQYICVD